MDQLCCGLPPLAVRGLARQHECLRKPDQVVAIGDGSVAKEALILRHSEGRHRSGRVTTIGIDLHTQLILLPAVVLNLPIEDVARYERFGVSFGTYQRGFGSDPLSISQFTLHRNLETCRWILPGLKSS
mgnify:CR=1 FL=1